MKINFKINLTKKQQEIYDLCHRDDIRYVIACMSRQCGKSVIAEVLLIEHLFKKNTFSAYISPSFSQGRKVYGEIIKLLDGKNIIKKSNSSTLTIETIFNSTLQFFSIESPNAIRGYTISGVLIIDEAAFIPDTLPDGTEPFSSIIMPITKARTPKILIISTPKGKRGMFFSLWSKALANEEGFASVKATIEEDSLISKEELENIKSIVSPQAYREEFMCEFLDSSLTFFQGFENCFTQYTYNNTIPQYIGIDLSANGKDETIVTKINQNNQIEQHKIQGTLDSKYQKIADIINNTNNLVTVYIENNGIGAPIINEVQKLLPRTINLQSFTTTNDSKTRILSDLALNISKSEIYFNTEDKELFSQFSTFIYKYTKTGKLQLEAQSGHKDDRVMSLAIALACKSDNTSLGTYTLNFHKKKPKIYRLAQKYENIG